MKVVPKSTATIISGFDVDAIVPTIAVAAARKEGISTEGKQILTPNKDQKE